MIGAKAEHKSEEFICGFDNFVLTLKEAVGISSLTPSQQGEGSKKWYDLSGRRIESAPVQRGIYIHGNRKIVK